MHPSLASCEVFFSKKIHTLILVRSCFRILENLQVLFTSKILGWRLFRNPSINITLDSTFIASLQNFEVSFGTPCFVPWISHQPVLASVFYSPSENPEILLECLHSYTIYLINIIDQLLNFFFAWFENPYFATMRGNPQFMWVLMDRFR